MIVQHTITLGFKISPRAIADCVHAVAPPLITQLHACRDHFRQLTMLLQPISQAKAQHLIEFPCALPIAGKDSPDAGEKNQLVEPRAIVADGPLLELLERFFAR